HGFTVEVVDAPASGRPGHALDLVARVTMLCGCPTEPGGMWDADRYSLEVALVQGERVVATAPLTWSGERSVYDGSVVVPDGTRAGDYALRIVAVDSERANAGMVLHPVRVGG
ncbi:MAG: hypothetical protein HKN71_08930, partial [Gemmatimonadetes bacterium]|nr:hypothetical protein [Gemmatimonadota bacterium]